MVAKVIFLMSDYGHDPTETAVPFTHFKEAGFEITFATEKGESPKCDSRMLEGITQILLGATKSVVSQYNAMIASPEWASPLSWTTPTLDLSAYDLVFLPGGHDKGVSQVIDSARVHELIAAYFPLTARASEHKKAIGAVCHGVMVLSETPRADGKSVLNGAITTALPTRFEQLAFWGTRAFLGDYYKTYGACSENVEEAVTKKLAQPSDFKNSLKPAPFVVEDPTFNYISARFPGDVQLMSEKLVALTKSLTS